MATGRRVSLASWTAGILPAGRVVFEREEAIRETGINHGAFLDAAERLQRKRHLFSPRQGFYVVVPSQFLPWGAPPPPWYIDDLMRFEHCAYYVGLLKAAELHGATHQAVMEFQVVTDKRLPRIRAGRSTIAFHYRKRLDAVRGAVQDRKTETGRMKLSSPELTVLDLVRYPRAAGGMDTVATVLADLTTRIDPERLAALSRAFERPITQRLGYLLDRLGHQPLSEPLHALRAPAAGWIELDPSEASDPAFATAPVERDDRWRVVVRRFPDIDH